MIRYTLNLVFTEDEPDPGGKALILGKYLDDAWDSFNVKYGDNVDDESGWDEHPYYT